ncbi:MAG: family transcriptional regulator, cyclic receptor protein [Solirubrobacteraceae bacterium]|nr:family transcriptional regulator, cyclic receptor protein [Solirubrobacteraceae bacterium]
MTSLRSRTSPSGQAAGERDFRLGRAGNGRRRTTSLLDADPDLGIGLWGEEFLSATRGAIARVIHLNESHGGLSWIEDGLDASGLGLFVLEGLLVRSVTVGRRSAGELLGTGDLIGPAANDRGYDGLSVSVDWRAVCATSVAVLDSGFALRIAPWPTVAAQLIARATHRTSRLALIQAAARNPRVAPRLLVMFWLFAQRWGTVGPDGIHVTLPLTHKTIANLAGAARPTVTSTLQQLARADLLRRESPSRWLLSNQALQSVANPEGILRSSA